MSTFSRLHMHPIGGIAGDMLLAALLDLGADIQAVRAAMQSTGEPGLRLDVDQVEVDGLAALYVRSLPSADRGGAHGHTHLDEVLEVVERAEASAMARRRATEVFLLLAEAEGVVHGATADTVGLHEVGELDSILDVLGISVALDSLGNPEVVTAPLPSGRGSVMTSHGRLTCPVPVVREIATRFSIPLIDAPLEGETVTPTGIAIVAAAAQVVSEPPPAGALRIGRGAGTRRFVGIANVLEAHGWPP